MFIKSTTDVNALNVLIHHWQTGSNKLDSFSLYVFKASLKFVKKLEPTLNEESIIFHKWKKLAREKLPSLFATSFLGYKKFDYIDTPVVDFKNIFCA